MVRYRENGYDKTILEVTDTVIQRFCDKKQIMVNSYCDNRNQRRNTCTDRNHESLYTTPTQP